LTWDPLRQHQRVGSLQSMQGQSLASSYGTTWNIFIDLLPFEKYILIIFSKNLPAARH
jgi:hypothetical protein